MQIEIDTQKRIIRITRTTAMANDAEFERKHPRDKDGRFGAGGGSTIKITTKPIADIKFERKKAMQWYKNNLQGKTITHPALGNIKFTRRGGEHSLHNCAEKKLALIPHLPQLIENGKCSGWQPLKHERNDGFVAFAVITNKVQINATTTPVGCFIAKDANGNIFYDLYIDKTVASYIPKDEVRADNSFDTESITDSELIVNIFFEGE